MAGRLWGAWEATFCRGNSVMGQGLRALTGRGSSPAHLPDKPVSAWAGRTSRLGWRWVRRGPGGPPVHWWPLLGTCRHPPCRDLWRERSELSSLQGTCGTKFPLSQKETKSARTGKELWC